jgi:hypothetical protein
VLLTQNFSDDRTEKNEMGGACSAYGGWESLTQVWWGNLKKKRPLGKPRRRWEHNIKWIFRKWDVGTWAGSSWLRIGTGGRNL